MSDNPFEAYVYDPMPVIKANNEAETAAAAIRQSNQETAAKQIANQQNMLMLAARQQAMAVPGMQGASQPNALASYAPQAGAPQGAGQNPLAQVAAQQGAPGAQSGQQPGSSYTGNPLGMVGAKADDNGVMIGPAGTVHFPSYGGREVDGLSLPQDQYWGAMSQADFGKALNDAGTARDHRNYQRAAQANTDGAWNAAIADGVKAGDISPSMGERLYNRPEYRAMILKSYAGPDSALSYSAGLTRDGMREDTTTGTPVAAPDIVAAQAAQKGTVAGAEARARGDLDTTSLTVKNKDGTYSPQTMTKSQAADYLRGQPGAAPSYSAAITGWENAGGNPAQANTSGPGGTSTSTAVGNGQFTRAGWIQDVREMRPDLAKGKTDAEIAALRTDPQISGQMIEARAGRNSQRFSELGVPANAPTLALAHRYGADGAAAILRASQQNPGLTLQQVLPAAAQKNPALASLTVGGIVGDAGRRFMMVQAPGQQPSGGPAGSPDQAAAAGQDGGAAMPGIAGMPQLTPQAQKDLEIATARTKAQNDADIGLMKDYRSDLTKQSKAAQSQNFLIDQMKDEMPGWTSGPNAASVGKMNAVLDDISQRLGYGKPDPGLGRYQDFVKNEKQVLSAAVHMNNQAGGFHITQAMESGSPNASMSPTALRDMFSQMQGMNDWLMAKERAASKFTGKSDDFDSDWNTAVSVVPFMLRHMSPDQRASFAQRLTATPEGRQEWRSIVGQAQQIGDNGTLNWRTR
ncbi:hypothetical protein [Gluconacetobacter diazotrophicus]|nr:hypothetical protein [Gluconacetobacter diazotrophicus]